MRLEEKFRFCAGASQNLAPKLRRALRAFNLPEPFQGLLKAFQGPAAVGRPSRGSKEASQGASLGPPRGLPKASQGPPRGLPGASQGPPRASQSPEAEKPDFSAVAQAEPEKGPLVQQRRPQWAPPPEGPRRPPGAPQARLEKHLPRAKARF